MSTSVQIDNSVPASIHERLVSDKRSVSERLQMVYDTIDEALDSKSYSDVDCMLSKLDPSSVPLSVSLSVLTATGQHKNELPSRELLLSRLSQYIRSIGRSHDHDALLRGF